MISNNSHKDKKILALALINIVILSFGHAYNTIPIIIIALAAFVSIVLFSPRKLFLPIMLFYLPWSAILKTNPFAFSFFTLVVPVIFIIIIFDGLIKERKYNNEHLVIPLFFTAHTLFVKFFLNALPVQMPYLFFIMMIFFIPIYVSTYKKEISFETCVLFLTTGILSACISAEKLMTNLFMQQYIIVHKEIGDITRLSGFVGDGNYYSAQILVAIAALLIVLGKTTNKALMILQMASIIALIYFGMQSVSKMFIISIVVIMILWLFNLLIEKRSLAYKLGMIITVAIASGIIAVNNLFSDQINLYMLRFGMVTDMDTLTTGRNSIELVYLNYLFSHIDKIFLGIGLSQDKFWLLLQFDKAPHNTLIDIIYQLGIAGGLFLLWWWNFVYQELVGKIKMDISRRMYFLIMAASVFLPWLALDMLYSDEFFYFILLLFISKNYLSNASNKQLNNNKKAENASVPKEVYVC